MERIQKKKEREKPLTRNNATLNEFRSISSRKFVKGVTSGYPQSNFDSLYTIMEKGRFFIKL